MIGLWCDILLFKFNSFLQQVYSVFSSLLVLYFKCLISRFISHYFHCFSQKVYEMFRSEIWPSLNHNLCFHDNYRWYYILVTPFSLSKWTAMLSLCFFLCCFNLVQNFLSNYPRTRLTQVCWRSPAYDQTLTRFVI